LRVHRPDDTEKKKGPKKFSKTFTSMVHKDLVFADFP
jgi:hypothetical protein